MTRDFASSLFRHVRDYLFLTIDRGKYLDPIEPYKEKIVNKEMAPKVAAVLNEIAQELVIDCRSSTYQTVWQSPIEKTVEIKVFTTVNGERSGF